ncbi:MAG: LD-carboxypeptidase [Bacteroidales bacterium]|nr:LD-carboxypeptidase [Bacteroidales bacterium]
MSCITPPLLQNGDVIAITSPASAIAPTLIEGAVKALETEGFSVRVMPHAAGRHGSYSGTESERLSDIQTALDCPEIKAILCARGGYGAVHLLPHLHLSHPKWIIGFSDISALHALWHNQGWQSIHGSMAKELALCKCEGNEANRRLFEILRTGMMPEIAYNTHPGSIPGISQGKIIGGNLAVLEGLAATPYDILNEPCILVIEDIAEPIYKVERIFRRLRLSGALQSLKGLIVGQFTDYKPSADFSDMYSMISCEIADLQCPVSLGAPIGHIDNNLPFIEGAEITLNVNNKTTTIQQIAAN